MICVILNKSLNLRLLVSLLVTRMESREFKAILNWRCLAWCEAQPEALSTWEETELQRTLLSFGPSVFFKGRWRLSGQLVLLLGGRGTFRRQGLVGGHSEPWGAHWDLIPSCLFLLSNCYEVTGLLSHELLPWCTILPQAQSNKVKHPWTCKTKKQNKPCLLLSYYLRYFVTTA
jgi:hypothetical protein